VVYPSTFDNADLLAEEVTELSAPTTPGRQQMLCCRFYHLPHFVNTVCFTYLIYFFIMTCI